MTLQVLQIHILDSTYMMFLRAQCLPGEHQCPVRESRQKHAGFINITGEDVHYPHSCVCLLMEMMS